MGDLGDIYGAHKEESKTRRASHRDRAPDLLDKADIYYESKNSGAHLIVEGKENYIDFWPGTGKWIERKGTKGFGIKNLINYINS